jgi:hypothetical protein
MQWLINLFTSGLLSPIFGWLTSWMTARSNEQIADTRASEAIANTDTVVRGQVVQSEVGSRLLQWPRFIFEMGAALYFLESIVIDKVVASLLAKLGHPVDWSTDPITGPMGTVYALIVGSMFGASIADRVVSKLTGR